LLNNSASFSEISGGPARCAVPPEILLQLAEFCTKLQQDFWRPGAARRAARNLVATPATEEINFGAQDNNNDNDNDKRQRQ